MIFPFLNTLRLKAWALAPALAVCATLAGAQSLPNYYPPGGFERTASVDGLMPNGEGIVINDVRYRLASNLVIHAPNAFSVPRSRLRVGATIGYRLAGQRMIAEIWLLPRGYEPRGRRR